MITYGSTTLTSYNSIVKTEVYYYKSTSATSLSGGSWSTTKPTWENGKYIWQKIRTVYEDGTHTESDPVNITGQQGATGTAAYSYKLNSSDSIIGKTKDGEYTIKKITFSATYKQGTGAVSAYSGRFKIESTTNGSTWKTEYTSSGNEASKEFTIPDDIILIKCSLYQSDGTTVLLDIVTVPVVKDGVDAIGLKDSIPYYLASDKDTGITRLTQGWTRYRPQLTAEKKYLWVYYVSRYSEGTTEPELIEIKDDLAHFVNNGDESPIESCVVDIDPVQAGSGDPSPENVRPITGWTGAKVTRTGKNLLRLPTIEEITNAETVVYYKSIPIQLKPNTTYYLSTAFLNGYTAKGSGVVGLITNNPTINDPWVSFAHTGNNNGKVDGTITTGDSGILYIRFNGQNEQRINDLYANAQIQLELGSTATAYEPYQGTTYDITFPSEAGTVYGGTLDVTKGELTVLNVYLNMANIQEWYLQKDIGRVYALRPELARWPDTLTPCQGLLCNRFKSISFNALYNGTESGVAISGGSALQFHIEGLTNNPESTTQDIYDYFAEHETHVVANLATPITYQLTPQEITMLCNENNIFADTGQTAISYYDNQTSTDPFIDYSITSAFEYADTAMDRATATYGTCSTATNTAAKVVICPDFVLFDGARIQVTFTNANTASSPTLNVNSTGAKPIYINKTITSSSNLLLWTAGSKMEFVYDGTGWVAQNIPYALYGTCSTGASTATKDVTCDEAVICKGTTISVNMTNTNTAANATMNVGSTLAKDIYANGAKLTTNSRFNWRANTTQKFVFDGQVWRMDDDSVKALATAYITEINNDGIMVHPEDDSTSGWAISDAIQLFKSGISYIKLWIEDTVAKIRIGKEDQGHIILDNDSIDINNGDTNLASFSEQTRIGAENSDKMIISPTEMVGYMSNNQLLYRFYHYNNGSSVAHEITEDNGLMYTQTVPTSKHLEFYYTPKFSPEDNTTVSFTAIIYDVTFKEIYSVADSETYIYEEPEEGAIVDPAWTEQLVPSSGTRPQEDTIIDLNSVGTLIDGYGGCKLGVRFNILQYNYDRISVKFIVTYTTTGMREYRYYTFGDRVDEINAGDMSFIIGNNINASGENSIGLGKDIKSLGVCSYAQGLSTQATADYSYAEGCSTKAQGIGSHAEGISVQANKYASHAEGCHTISNGDYSHAQNYYTTASSHSQTAIGKYNKIDSSNKYALIIGNGNASEKSNALALTWDGNVELFLDVNAASTTLDYALYNAIHALNWDSYVLLND